MKDGAKDGVEDDSVEVVVAHSERATLRVGDTFLKVDTDQDRADREVAAMQRAPVPTAEVLWRRPPVLALRRLTGTPLGRLGRGSSASPRAWAAAGAAARALHDATPPAWDSQRYASVEADLETECVWLVSSGALPADVVRANRDIAGAALRPWTPVFTHGDLQTLHVFVDGDEVTGVLDWSEAGRGDAAYDLAILTLGFEERLPDVLAGYGTGVDVEAVRGWWSARSLLAARWLLEHGFDPDAPGCELDVLRRAAARG